MGKVVKAQEYLSDENLSRNTLTGVCYSPTSFDVLGYEITDALGVKKLISLEKTHSLIKQGQIVGCELIEDEKGNPHIYSSFDISDLPIVSNSTKFNGLTIVKKMVKSNDVIGYICRDANGTEYKLSKQKVSELALQNDILNAVIKCTDDVRYIVGKNCSLWELPIERV